MTQPPESPEFIPADDPDWRALLKVQLAVIMAEVSRGLDMLNEALHDGGKND